MMKSKLTIIFAFLGLVLTMTSCSDTAVAPTELPQEIQAFVKANFPDKEVSYAEKELDWFDYKYDITLADGTKISFDTSNQWTQINTKTNPVPSQLIPAPVSTYVNTKFPSVEIVKIDKEDNGFEAKLANGLEIKLNKQGELIKVDD